MKIGHLTSDDFGGVSAVIHQLLVAATEHGTHVHEAVIADIESERVKSLSNRLGNGNYREVPSLKFFSRLRWLLRHGGDYDVLVAHKTAWYFWVGIYKLMVSWQRIPRFVVVFHDSSLFSENIAVREQVTNYLMRWTCWKIVVVRESFRNQVVERLHYRGRVYHISNAVAHMSAAESVKFDRTKNPVILSLSRLDDEGKDIGTILLALQTLQRSDIRLTVGGEGHLRQYWERMSGELDLQDHVDFVGEVVDVELFMHKGVAFVLSSNFVEGGPLVMLEAMMCGVPVIASRTAIPTWAIENDLCLTFSTGDAQDLASVIALFLSMDEAEITQMTHRARTFVKMHFDVRAQLKAYEEVLSEEDSAFAKRPTVTS